MAKATTALGSGTLVAKEALSISKASTFIVLLLKTTELNSAVPTIPRKPLDPPIVLLTRMVWFPVPSKFPIRVNLSVLALKKSAPNAHTEAGNCQVIVLEALLPVPAWVALS
jgi:uncharacterized membrane protein (DUF441 family)